jgi:uncharacterized membrane protein SpoIIM required for sporulation
MNKLKLKRYCELVLSVLLALLCAAFIFSAYHLYLTGGTVPYSRARVIEYLTWLLPISLIVILAIIFMGVLSLMTKEQDKLKTSVSVRAIYKRRSARVSDDLLLPENKAIIEGEKKRRLFILISCIAVTVIYAVITVAISLDFSRYTVATCTDDVAALSLIIFPPALIIAVFAALMDGLYVKSLSKSCEAYKAEIDIGNNGGVEKEDPASLAFVKKNEDKILLITRIALVSLAVVFIVLGIFNGTMADVLGKAVKICTECIGLG